jgi:DNA-binding transcriptional regulator LsrR (DeoR family)
VFPPIDPFKFEKALQKLRDDEEFQSKMIHAYWFGTDKRIGPRAFEQVSGLRVEKGSKESRRVSEAVVLLVDDYLNRGHTLVRLVPLDVIYPELEIELGDKLRREYGLRDVWVVNTKFVRSKRPALSETDEDNKVHRYLANWAARMLSTIIRQGDVLGMGSGRALNAVGRAVTDLSGFQGCSRICALTGNMKVRLWGDGGHKDTVDANDNARSLYSYVPNRDAVKLDLLEADITDVKARGILETYQSRCNVAVVGIGALGGRHQLRRVADAPAATVPAELTKVMDTLKALNDLSEAYDSISQAPDGGGSIHRHIVSDVCNYLFLNEGLAHRANVPVNETNKMRGLIDTINLSFLNTSPLELSKICQRGAVIAVAGGRHKLSAVYDVLERFGPSGRLQYPAVSHLVVDDLVATELVRMK